MNAIKYIESAQLHGHLRVAAIVIPISTYWYWCMIIIMSIKTWFLGSQPHTFSTQRRTISGITCACPLKNICPRHKMEFDANITFSHEKLVSHVALWQNLKKLFLDKNTSWEFGQKFFSSIFWNDVLVKK